MFLQLYPQPFSSLNVQTSDVHRSAHASMLRPLAAVRDSSVIKVDCSALCAPATSACIRNSGCRPPYSYRLARPMSIGLRMQACSAPWPPSGTFIVESKNRLHSSSDKSRLRPEESPYIIIPVQKRRRKLLCSDAFFILFIYFFRRTICIFIKKLLRIQPGSPHASVCVSSVSSHPLSFFIILHH